MILILLVNTSTCVKLKAGHISILCLYKQMNWLLIPVHDMELKKETPKPLLGSTRGKNVDRRVDWKDFNLKEETP